MLDILDSEILKLEKVNQWAADRQGTTKDVDQFTKDLREQVNLAGFECQVKVYDTNEPGVYSFEIELTGRLSSMFDPDQMVHEVTSNLLELPGQDKGFVNSREYLDKLVNREMSNKKNKGKHKH